MATVTYGHQFGHGQRRPLPSPATDIPRPLRPAGLIDRAARRLGVILLTWARRPRTADSREQSILRAEQYRAQEARERVAERRHRLMVPRL